MSTLETQSDFRKVQHLPFCYLCGKEFQIGDVTDEDHVPPKAIFAKADRTPPLKLQTHRKCNGDRSTYDEQIGQFLSVIHGQFPKPERIRLQLEIMEKGEQPFLALRGTNIKTIVGRWIRGFHAALYGGHLPSMTGNFIHLPFPGGNVEPDGTITYENLLTQHKHYVSVIKKNRVARKLDRIVCFNGKCIYECVWDNADRGEQICVFALQIYDWKQLADTRFCPQRGCVGMYLADRPIGGTKTTLLNFPFANADPLDAFAS